MNKLIKIIIFCNIVLLSCVNCSKRVDSYYGVVCDGNNKDSIIQCILTNYDEQALNALAICYDDSNYILYQYLIADSAGGGAMYFISPSDREWYGLSDTTTLFYEVKGIVTGGYDHFDDDGAMLHRINFPDSIYTFLCDEYNRRDYSIEEYSNIDSLYNATFINADTCLYGKLRRFLFKESILPISIEIANKTHSPIACYDVYWNSVRQEVRLSSEEFQFAYRYLCEAADSMYYPAIFLKAGLCLTGAYFPQDTILGKKILEQCHGKTNIPFWQQYTRPAIYHHLLIDNITRDK